MSAIVVGGRGAVKQCGSAGRTTMVLGATEIVVPSAARRCSRRMTCNDSPAVTTADPMISYMRGDWKRNIA
jgi:hypothetical protein